MKLSSALPEGVANGLGAIYGAVCERPEEDYLIVAIVTGKSLTTDVDTGAVVPTVRVARVEAITDVNQWAVVQSAMSMARARRTGQTSIDPATGEIQS